MCHGSNNNNNNNNNNNPVEVGKKETNANESFSSTTSTSSLQSLLPQKKQPPPPERIHGDTVVQQQQQQQQRLDHSRIAPFDRDIRDDCRSLLSHCTSDIFAHVFLQCPASCTQLLHEEGMRGIAATNTEALYDISVVMGNTRSSLRTYQGQRVQTDRFEGYVLVVAILPLLPGMAVYYYEMMEHLHSIFVPKVELVIIPMDLQHGIHIQPRKDGKVVLLEEESVTTALHTHPWIKHLSSIRPRSGLGTRDDTTTTTTTTTDNDDDDNQIIIKQRPIQTDRVTFYIVSADGYYIESLISPTMKLLQKKISLYTKTIDYEL
jgi:hypothetical protein